MVLTGFGIWHLELAAERALRKDLAEEKVLSFFLPG
jgi:hypothetical protein